MLSAVSYVALGGALGASCRYLFGIAMVRLTGPTELPLAIMTVNILGSLLMGVFVAAAAHRGLTHLGPLVATGLLGGFTTFSAFSLETVSLIERGQIALAGTYVALSVILSVAALMLGLWIARGIFA